MWHPHACRLYELELRRQQEEAMGARPPEPDAGADWDQRRMQADHDLESTLEQERLRQARGSRSVPVPPLSTACRDRSQTPHVYEGQRSVQACKLEAGSQIWLFGSAMTLLLFAHEARQSGRQEVHPSR